MSDFKNNDWVKKLERSAKNICSLIEKPEPGLSSFAMIMKDSVCGVVTAWWGEGAIEALDKWLDQKNNSRNI